MKKQTALFIVMMSLFSFGCSKKASPLNLSKHTVDAISASEDFFNYPQEITLYNPNQINAKKIKECVFSYEAEKSCKVEESSFIGYGKKTITVNDVLNRTMSSRASYVETFKSILLNMPPQVIQMFGAVNAIVISERIVQSFYHPATGAIYLSSSYFWKTPEEKALIVTKDFRASFGQILQFSEESDYLKSGTSLYEVAYKKYRTATELTPYAAKVIIHELSHANDFYPKSFYNSNELHLNDTFYEIVSTRYDGEKTLSQNFKTSLSSKTLLRMGAILFQGEQETAEDLAVTPKEIVAEYKDDVAVDFYAYSSPNEDFAMLVERALMFKYFQYINYAVIIKYPHANFSIPEGFDYPIAGGIKNKIADPKVKERVFYAVESVFDKNYAQEVDNQIATLKTKEIPEGTQWSQVNNL